MAKKKKLGGRPKKPEAEKKVRRSFALSPKAIKILTYEAMGNASRFINKLIEDYHGGSNRPG